MPAKTIRPEDIDSLREAIEGGECTLLDVRERAEFEAGHIPLAVLIPLSEVAGRAGELDKGRTIVVYCRTQGRSGRCAEMLSRMGFQDVYVLEGGFTRWKDRQRAGAGER